MRQQQRKRRSEGLSNLLGGPASANNILVARSVVEHGRAWAGVEGRVVDDDKLGRVLRELGDRVGVVVLDVPDPGTSRALEDRMPALLVVTGDPEPEALDELLELAARQGCELLGPRAALRVGPSHARDRDSDEDRPTPIACAAHIDELDRLCEALGPTRLALAPTPAWLPRWLAGPLLLSHDVVGYVPADALSLAWLDWLELLGPRELRQLLVPLGIPELALEAEHPALEPALVAQSFERIVGPTYPAPKVLSLLREGITRHLDETPAHEPGHESAAVSPGARALWDQARRALPGFARSLGMREPHASMSLQVPTAAFLAQRGLLRLQTSQRLLASGFEEPEFPEPDLLDRADVVLEGAGEILSDHESKVVLRGHGVEVTRQAFANSASGAASFADKIGYPVVLKGLSPDLRRKTDLGAIELDVSNAAAAKRAYATIVANIEERAPTVQLDGVVIAEMIEPGLDLRCGGLRMHSGGVCLFAQALLDSPVEPKLAPSPLSPEGALLLAEAVLAAVPLPARRRASDPDVNVLATLLLRLDGLFRHTGERLSYVDLSPVRLLDSTRQYVTLDARIVQRPHLEGR